MARHAQLIGYARASPADPDNRHQRNALWHCGVSTQNLYEDAAGRQRPLWRVCLENLRSGDLLVVTAIDRLGRDLVEIIAAVKALSEKGVEIKALNDDLDTTTRSGKRMGQTIARLMEWEERTRRERSMLGLAVARTRGLSRRKPKITHAQALVAMQRIQAGEPGRLVAAEYNVRRQTIYRKVDELRRMT